MSGGSRSARVKPMRGWTALPPETLLAACGTSCRHQIGDGIGREARHIVRILDEASTL